METLTNLLDTVLRLWYSEAPKKEVEGYLMSSTPDKTQLLVKKGDKYWKTEWFNNSEHTFKSPTSSINSILKV
jgi:hypothetical protein